MIIYILNISCMLRWVLIVLVDVDTHHQTKMCLLLLLLPNIYPFSGHSCYVFLSPVSRLKLVIMLGLKLNTRTWILMSVVLIITTGISDESTEPDVEGEALLDVLRWLNDTKGRITDWNFNFVSPCSSWSHVTCRDSHVITLSLASIGFSGTLSPAIARLQYLTTLDLHDNRLTGSLPDYIANLTRLQYLNLANNRFTSSIPSSWARLSSLKHLVLRENPITGTIPDSIASISGLTQLDLSSTGLSGTIPSQLYSALEFNFTGTSLSCGASLKKPCASNYPRQGLFVRKSKVKGVLTSATCGALLVFLAGGVVAYRYQRHWNKLKRDVFFDVAGVEECEISLGQVRRFSLREVQVATENFSEGKVIGQGGFGKVYKGELADKTQVAVKRLGDCFSPGGEAAFLREVQLISVAVHRNLLRLIGFCTTPSERILVYPFMPMLSVAFRLREAEEGLDWARRHRIAVGSARGLEYLHEQRIIHRDLKAANILLDAQLEPVLGDFGLAKPLDPTLTHVTTQVRGTMGHIAPEYLSTGKSSHKTDVFGYGITLLELVTGQRAIDFSRLDDVLLLDHIKKAQREKRVDSIVDSRLRSYDAKEVETVVKVALLCTQASPEDRPTMTQVLKMLDGVGLSQRWAHWEQLDHLRAPHDLSLYSHHFAWADDSTHDHQPIHLSKPR